LMIYAVDNVFPIATSTGFNLQAFDVDFVQSV
jgi:hypothetical protein